MYIYSPLPVTSYFLPGLEGRCPTGAISRMARAQSAWNLYWLSTPDLDNLPGHTGHWSSVFKVRKGAVQAIACDVILDEVLHRKLLTHPSHFAAWFQSRDISDYQSFSELGAAEWRSVVISRAEIAARRMAAEVPAIGRASAWIEHIQANSSLMPTNPSKAPLSVSKAHQSLPKEKSAVKSNLEVSASVDAARIKAARRGAAVENYYSDIISTIAFKFALNGGAKPLLFKAIAATQTIGSAGLPKDPKPGTLKSDLVHVLRMIASSELDQADSRNFELAHPEREASARAFAANFVDCFSQIRSTKR